MIALYNNNAVIIPVMHMHTDTILFLHGVSEIFLQILAERSMMVLLAKTYQPAKFKDKERHMT